MGRPLSRCGQPILVGHHSERRHRRDIERIARDMDAACAAQRESDEAARRAEASERRERHRLTGPATLRRIETLEAEARDVARKLDRAEPDTDWHARLTERAAELAEELAYWTDHLASLEAAGTFTRWSAADFAPGDKVVTRFGVRDVVRVNRKSLTVSTPYSWTDTLPYADVRGKVELESAPESDEQPAVEETAPAVVVTRSSLQSMLLGHTRHP